MGAESVGIRIVHIEEFFRLGPDAVVAEARRIVGDGPVYVSFDVDGLDPVYAPGTGTPEIGGFSTAEAQRMIRGLDGLDLVGGDVVEVAPPFDPTRQHRAGRRDDDVRDPVRAGARPCTAARTACAGCEIRLSPESARRTGQRVLASLPAGG